MVRPRPYITTHLAFVHGVQAAHHAVQSGVARHSMRMGNDFAGAQELVRNVKPAPPAARVSGFCHALVGRLPLDGLVEHGQRENPVWLHTPQRMSTQRKRFQAQILAPITAECLVADFHRGEIGIGDAVESDTTKGVSSSRQPDGGHGSRNPLRSVYQLTGRMN
ncbi:hypothetical protein IFM51744_07911 [Aspergillus udagawae]|nr:hypothetical protein IFM51744_07911 [Aspergillus udagawae]